MDKIAATSLTIAAPVWRLGEAVEKLKSSDASSELIARAQQRDASALRELVLLWQPRVRNLVRYLVRGDDQVDDVSQQALLTALEKLHGFRGEGRIEAWLDGIVLRITLRSMRRFRLRRSREVEHVDDLQPTAAATASYSERRKLIAALDHVPHKQRSALVMRHVLGMSAREIAEFEGIPEETARSRLKLGMSLLRARFRTRLDIHDERAEGATGVSRTRQ